MLRNEIPVGAEAQARYFLAQDRMLAAANRAAVRARKERHALFAAEARERRETERRKRLIRHPWVAAFVGGVYYERAR